MEFFFSCSTWYLTNEYSEQVGYEVKHNYIREDLQNVN